MLFCEEKSFISEENSVKKLNILKNFAEIYTFSEKLLIYGEKT
jgi:hypothetical protein